MLLSLATAILTIVLPATSFGSSYFNIFSDSTRQELPSGKNTKPADYPKKGAVVKKIVIDPGHGGHDPGCIGANSYEKEIALGIGKKLAAYIAEQYPDVKVLMTRDSDFFVPLHERAQAANREAADLFVSIHCNYVSRSSQVQGSETYVLGAHKLEENLQVALRENSAVLHEENYESVYGFDPNSPEAHIIMSMFQNAYLGQSILFAGKVEQHMTESASRQSRGVKQAGFLVLRETAMPSVLIETGFLSNNQEERYLRTEEGQSEIALAILRAFGDYKAEVEGTVAQTNGNYAPLPPAVAPLPVSPPPPPGPSTYAVATPVSQPAVPVNSGAVTFKIQIAAASNPLNTTKDSWAALTYPFEVVTENGMIKYHIPAGNDLQKAQMIKQDARARGFPDAFITAYHNGQKISMDEAKKILGLE